MAIYGNPLLIGGGAGGINDTLPPLLNDFFASRSGDKISISASKASEERGTYLAGAVWVYGDHVPQSINDGARINVGRNEIVENATKERALTSIVTIPSKSKVRFGRFQGNELTWHTTKDEEKKQYLVFTKETAQLEPFAFMEVDAKEPQNSDNNIKNYGNVDFPKTNLFQWMNSDAAQGQWYSAQSSFDTPPSYQKIAGFLHDFTASEKSAILQNNWSMEILGKLKTVNAKVSIPSLRNANISGQAGTPFDIYNSDSDRTIPNKHWWTSTSFSDGRFLCDIGTDGRMGYRNPYVKDTAVNICIAVDPEMKVTLKDGIYEGVSIVKKEISFPENKDFYVRQFTYNTKKQYQTMLEGAVYHIKAGGGRTT